MTDAASEPRLFAEPGPAKETTGVGLAEAIAAFDALPDGFYAVDSEWRIVALNRVAADTFRVDREATLGKTLWSVLPHLVGSDFERRYRLAMRSRAGQHYIGPVPGRPGPQVEVWVRPFGDGLGLLFRDVTARRREEEENRATAAKLSLAIHAGRMAVWEHDSATDTLKGSPELNALLGFGPDELLDSASLRARFVPGDRERVRAAAVAALAAGERFFDSEVRLRAHDGQVRWFWIRAEITLDPDGAPVRTLGVVIDMTDRVRIESQLAERQADLDAALGAGKMAFIDFDHRTGLFKPSARLNELYGYDPDRVLTLEDVRARYHPEDAPRIAGWFSRYAADPGLVDWRWTFRLLLPDGGVRWVEGTGAYERGEDGAILRSRGVLQDVTERQRWEEHQRLLINELNHRVKNTLAIVQGLAQQSLTGPDASAAFTRFEHRLTALAAAHSLLTRRQWESTAVDEVARSAVEAATGDGLERVRLDGPKVAVRPQTAVALSLALHELCTNALKYGALSTPGGGVELGWSVAGDAAPKLRLVWREAGGPEVVPPKGKGFGRRLLERALARELGGTVALEFLPQGVTCTIEAPLAEAAPLDPIWRDAAR